MAMRIRFGLRTLLFLVAVCACVIWFWRQVEGDRRLLRAFNCRNNIWTLSFSVQQYHEQHGKLPPAVLLGPDGTPWHSWRVLILPFMEERELFKRYRFSEPWNGPNNRKLLPLMPRFFRCDNRAHDDQQGITSYVAITGIGTAFPPSGIVSWGDVKDGPEQTIYLVEAENLQVYWTEPRDFPVELLQSKPDGSQGLILKSSEEGGAAAAPILGQTFRCRRNLRGSELLPYTTIAGGEPTDPNFDALKPVRRDD